VRPVLRPGTALLRRDRAHLQLGIEPGRAVVVRDSPTVRALLTRLDGVRAQERVLAECLDPPAAAEALAALVGAGVVVDADEVRAAAVPSEFTHLLTRTDAGAAGVRLLARRVATVGLVANAPRADDLLVAAGALLAGSGIGRLVAEPHVAARIPSVGGWRHALPSPQARPDVTLVAGSPVTSAGTRALRADRIDHLVVSQVDGVATVGPFVRPGVTACVGCVDQARTARDPSWSALTHQLGAASATVPAPDLPGPRSRVLEAAASTWAVRDLLAHVEGDRVLCYGASLRFADDLVDHVVHRWERHPGCECRLPA